MQVTKRLCFVTKEQVSAVSLNIGASDKVSSDIYLTFLQIYILISQYKELIVCLF